MTPLLEVLLVLVVVFLVIVATFMAVKEIKSSQSKSKRRNK